MAGWEPVPEADRLEQDMPPSGGARASRPLPPDVPDADAIEQELPVSATDVPDSVVGIDDERSEPLLEDGHEEAGGASGADGA